MREYFHLLNIERWTGLFLGRTFPVSCSQRSQGWSCSGKENWAGLTLEKMDPLISEPSAPRRLLRSSVAISPTLFSKHRELGPAPAPPFCSLAPLRTGLLLHPPVLSAAAPSPSSCHVGFIGAFCPASGSEGLSC